MQADQGATDGWREIEAMATTAAPRAPLSAALGSTGVWWLLRVLLPAALTASLVLEYALLPYDPCTVTEPCLPAPGWSLLDGLQLGATVAVWIVPGAGLPLAALAGVPYLVDLVSSGSLATGSGAAASAYVLVALAGSWLVHRLCRWRPPSSVPRRLPARGRDVLASRGPGTVEVGVLLSALATAGLLGWFAYLAQDTRAHLSRAEPALVEVVDVDDVDWLVEVRVPGASGSSEVGVYDVELFDIGDRVPALVDRTVEPVWVSLESEPVEHDGWLVLAGAAVALFGVVGGARVSGLRRRRRLLVEGGSLWSTTASPGADGSRVLLPELGLGAPLVRRLPADGFLEAAGLLSHVTTADLLGTEPVEMSEDERQEEERRRQEEFGEVWRGERLPDVGQDEDHEGAEPVVLVGDPRPGGVVLVVTASAVLAPYGPLTVMSPLEARRLRVDGQGHAGDVRNTSSEWADEAEDGGLPGSVAAPLPGGAEPRGADGRPVQEVPLAQPRWRVLGAAALLLLPAAFWLTADAGLPPEEQLSWFQALSVLVGAGSLAFGGLAFARSSVRLTPDGVHVGAHGFVVVHPWPGVAGVRVVDGQVVVAFGVGDDGDLDAVEGPPGGAVEPLVAAALAERWRVEAGQDRAGEPAPPRRTVDPLVGGAVVLYALTAAAWFVWPLLGA